MTVWLDAVGSNLPSKLLPRPWVLLPLQVAALFPAAALGVDRLPRREGWSCAGPSLEKEVDVRPYFPLDADNKENRFQRALQFYRKNRTVMRELERLRGRARERERLASASRQRSLLTVCASPTPRLDSTSTPWSIARCRATRRIGDPDWYWTPASRIAERCGDKTTAPSDDDDAAPSSKGSRALTTTRLFLGW